MLTRAVVVFLIFKIQIACMTLPIDFESSCSADKRSAFRESQKVKQFLSKLSSPEFSHTFKAERLVVHEISMFGKMMGFSYVTVLGRKPPDSDKVVPSYVFLRGDAVCVLVVLIDSKTGSRHILVTQQTRVPAGEPYLIEACAGMLDEEKNLRSVAIKEMAEELTLVINEKDLIPLHTGFYPSAGGCDEKIHLFLFEKKLPHDVILSFNKKRTGNASENETITTKLIPYEEAISNIGNHLDAKLVIGLALYKIRHGVGERRSGILDVLAIAVLIAGISLYYFLC